MWVIQDLDSRFVLRDPIYESDSFTMGRCTEVRHNESPVEDIVVSDNLCVYSSVSYVGPRIFTLPRVMSVGRRR